MAHRGVASNGPVSGRRRGRTLDDVADPRAWRLVSCLCLVVAVVAFVGGAETVAWPALAASALAFVVELGLEARERGR
jgi:hypothetical protein